MSKQFLHINNNKKTKKSRYEEQNGKECKWNLKHELAGIIRLVCGYATNVGHVHWSRYAVSDAFIRYLLYTSYIIIVFHSFL